MHKTYRRKRQQILQHKPQHTVMRFNLRKQRRHRVKLEYLSRHTLNF